MPERALELKQSSLSYPSIFYVGRRKSKILYKKIFWWGFYNKVYLTNMNWCICWLSKYVEIQISSILFINSSPKFWLNQSIIVMTSRNFLPVAWSLFTFLPFLMDLSKSAFYEYKFLFQLKYILKRDLLLRLMNL